MNAIRKLLIFGVALFGASVTPSADAQTAPSIVSIGVGPTNKNIELTILGYSGVTYAVNASTNLANWATIGTVGFLAPGGTQTEGYLAFEDTDAHLFNSRFYDVIGTNLPMPVSSFITSPTNGLYMFGVPFTLNVQVTDPSGTITNLAYWLSGTNINPGTGTNLFPTNGLTVFSAPYLTPVNLTMTNSGTFQVWAVVEDDNGVLSTSTNVTFMVDTNHPPVFTAPINVGTDGTGGTLFTTAIFDYEGMPSRVDYYVDSAYIGTGRPSAYSFVWRGTAGSHSVQGQAFDAYGASTWSASVPFTLVPIAPPSITITNPVSGSFLSQSNIPIQATVSASLTVSRVDFFIGSNYLSTCFSSPYYVVWQPSAAGIFALTAQVTDAGNEVSVSDPVYVQMDTNHPPTVSIINTNANQTIPYNSPATLTVIASDYENRLASVYLFDGENGIGGVQDQNTNVVSWSSSIPGLHIFYAAATDQQGLTTWSHPTYLTVAADVPPFIVITSPQANQLLTNGSDITFAATVTDSNAVVSRVDYYCDGAYVGSAQYPFTLQWDRFASLSLGQHQVYAVAYDYYGVSTMSSSVTFSIPLPPSVAITPASGSSFPTPGSVLVTATVTNTLGAVTNLVIVTNGTEWVAFTNAPGSAPSVYSNYLVNASAGTYAMYAVALDNQGLLTYSPTNTITVVASQPPTLTWQIPGSGPFTYNQRTNWQAIPSDQFTPASAMTASYYDNGTYIGQANSTANFIFTNYIPSPGTHTMKASTVNGSGTTGYANLTVTVLSNRPPVVALVSPANNSILESNTVHVAGTASDPDNDAVTIVTYVDGSPQATNAASAGAFSSTVTLAGGSQTISAAAFSYGFGPIYSATNAVSVATYPPTFTSISFDGHATNYSLNEPIQVEVAGIADPNLGGSVAKIDFYVNGAVAVTSTNPASTVTQTVAASPLLGGSYACYAILTDTIGSTTQTPTITCQASNRAPIVAFVSPANNSSVGLALPTNLTVTVNASDPDAGDSVTNVVFYVNGQPTSTNTTSSWSWYVPSAGAYQLTAIAHDTHGLASLAATNSVTVTNTGASTVLSLDGLSGYMKLANPFPDMAVFSVECWIYSRTNTTTGILLMDSDSTVGYTILGIASNNIILYANKSGGTLDTSVTVTNATLLNAWHHIAWTVSSTQSQLFVDGNLAATINEGGNNTGYHQTNPTIGAWNNGNSGPNRYFNGMLDEVRVWNIVLPQSQIQAQMNETLTGSEPGLIGYWNFDSGTANDGSPSGNNGTLVGGATILPHMR